MSPVPQEQQEQPALRPPGQRYPAARGQAGRRYPPPAVVMPALALLLVLAALAAAWVGAVSIPPEQIQAALLGQEVPPATGSILWLIRLPRILLAVLVGGGLATAGAALQGLLRNPLADPHLLGVSGGASVGAALALVLGLRWSLAGVALVPVMAFLGALAAVGLIWGLARVAGRVSAGHLVLAGVAVGVTCTAAISYLQTTADERLVKALLYWLAGGLGSATWQHVQLASPYVLVGLVLLLFFARDLDLMLMGEEAAEQAGVNVEATKRWVWLAASLVTAATVAVAGLIAFVGLVVPHILRLLVGPRHRTLLPASALGGAIFLLVADTLGRTLWAPQEVRVGIITGLLGGPFFLWLLRREFRHQI